MSPLNQPSDDNNNDLLYDCSEWNFLPTCLSFALSNVSVRACRNSLNWLSCGKQCVNSVRIITVCVYEKARWFLFGILINRVFFEREIPREIDWSARRHKTRFVQSSNNRGSFAQHFNQVWNSLLSIELPNEKCGSGLAYQY